MTIRTDARGVSVSYRYDPLGRLASVTDPTGTTRYAFDALSRVTDL